jgi:hypothetical protein
MRKTWSPIWRGVNLLAFIAVLTTSLQHWVGQSTIYSEKYASIRPKVHDLLVRRTGETADNNLRDLESFGNERRVVIPWIAEGLVRLVGNRETSLPAIYYYMDYLFLYLSFLAFWFYLRRWFDQVYCLLGLSFLAVVFITTYHLHFFHPWDRPTFLLWIILAMLVRDDRMLIYLPVLALTLCTKFTACLFPVFYLMVNAKRGWLSLNRRVWSMVAVQAGVILACNFLLNYLSITPAEKLVGTYLSLMEDIFRMDLYFFSLYMFAHPAFLMFICPVFLIPWRWKELDHFMRSSALFGGGVLLVHLCFSYFVESRALAVALVFLIPPAMRSLEKMGDGPFCCEPNPSEPRA